MSNYDDNTPRRNAPRRYNVFPDILVIVIITIFIISSTLYLYFTINKNISKNVSNASGEKNKDIDLLSIYP